MENSNGNEYTKGLRAGQQAATLETIQESLDRLERRLFGPDGNAGIVGKIEYRVSALERWRTFLTGAWAVLAGVFTVKHGG